MLRAPQARVSTFRGGTVLSNPGRFPSLEAESKEPSQQTFSPERTPDRTFRYQ